MTVKIIFESHFLGYTFMSGHSKWANIQHRKKRQDAKRGKLFSKLIREVMVAARAGGPNPEDNPRLRLALDKAQAANMPKDTLQRAIKRGCGDVEGATYEEIRYEGYGPGGVAVLIDCLSDNRNRTVSDIRHALTKHGGSLGGSGSVMYLFEATGVLLYAPGTDSDAVMEAAIEAGAEDVEVRDDESLEVLMPPQDFLSVRDAMSEAALPADHAEVTMRAQTLIDLDAEQTNSMQRLLNHLEELDDVQEVYVNANFPDEDEI